MHDVAGQPVVSWDSRGHRLRHTYDELRRPTEVWLRAGLDPEILVQRTGLRRDPGRCAQPPHAGLSGLRWRRGRSPAKSTTSRATAAEQPAAGIGLQEHSRLVLCRSDGRGAVPCGHRIRRAQSADRGHVARRFPDPADLQRGEPARTRRCQPAGLVGHDGVGRQYRLRRQRPARVHRVRQRREHRVRVRREDLPPDAYEDDASRQGAAGPAIHPRPGRQHHHPSGPCAALQLLRQRRRFGRCYLRLRCPLPADRDRRSRAHRAARRRRRRRGTTNIE